MTWELLLALGKRNEVTGAGRNESLNWEVLVAWVLAHGIAHIVMIDAQWLRTSMLADLVGLAAVTGTSLWLVAQHPIDPAYREDRAAWITEGGELSELQDILRATRTPPTTPSAADFPRVPLDDWPTFRSEARRQLRPDDFNAVDERYRNAFDTAQTWFGQVGEADEDSVLALIRPLLHDCSCADEMYVALRAIQAVAFRAGWLVQVDLPRLIVTAERAAGAAVHSPHTWERLLAYREPYRGAACVFAACELALATMITITFGCVAPEGTDFEVVRGENTERITVPPGAEVLLRAQLWQRRIQGARNDDPLLADDDGPLADRYLANAVRAPVTEVGVPLYSSQVERQELDPKRWSHRWGLSVQEL